MNNEATVVGESGINIHDIVVALNYHLRHKPPGSIILPALTSLTAEALVAVWQSETGYIYQCDTSDEIWNAVVAGFIGARNAEFE
jgi:hypothetical protein